MTRLANEVGAINLSQGFPDFDTSPELIESVARFMREGHNQYAPMPGVLALREALSRKIEKLYGRRYDPVTEITVTTGSTEGLFATITALVHPGDEVLLFQPAYDSYTPAVTLSGGTRVYATLRYPGLPHRLGRGAGARCHSRTRVIVINSPHNPTGMIWTADDIRELDASAAEHRCRRDCRRSVRAHPLRRAQARESRALSGDRRACRRDQLVREDVHDHRLEGRLLRRAARR